MKRIVTALASMVALLLPLSGGVAAHAATQAVHVPVSRPVVQPAAEPQALHGYLLNHVQGADGSYRCAGLYGTSLADNAVFTEYTCGSAGFHDQWTLIANFYSTNHHATWYQLRNTYSGKCAQLYNFSTVVGSDIVQYTCNAPVYNVDQCNNACSTQLWRFEDPDNLSYGNVRRIHNRYVDHCMVLPGGSLTDGTHIAQTNCGSSHLTDLWVVYDGLL